MTGYRKPDGVDFPEVRISFGVFNFGLLVQLFVGWPIR
jgi:hypothetical protein